MTDSFLLVILESRQDEFRICWRTALGCRDDQVIAADESKWVVSWGGGKRIRNPRQKQSWLIYWGMSRPIKYSPGTQGWCQAGMPHCLSLTDLLHHDISSLQAGGRLQVGARGSWGCACSEGVVNAHACSTGLQGMSAQEVSTCGAFWLTSSYIRPPNEASNY